MKKEELEIIYKIIKENAESFWNDEIGETGWNGYVFDERLAMLAKKGYDLKLVAKS
ncbi:MAG: hypothetical protein N2V78_09520 [Methanophagales archaeon]|nr:hypothetical protein [Methanophagales archaeon]